MLPLPLLDAPLVIGGGTYYFLVIRLLRGRAIGRSLWDAAAPIEKRLLFAACAPKLNAGLEARLGPH